MARLKFKMDTSADYTIRVAGILDQRWSDYLSGMTISTEVSGVEGHAAISTLKGRLVDQAALLGVLNALYDYQYPLLTLEYVLDD